VFVLHEVYKITRKHKKRNPTPDCVIDLGFTYNHLTLDMDNNVEYVLRDDLHRS